MFERLRQRRKMADAMIKLDQVKRETITMAEQQLREQYDELFRADMDGKSRVEAIELMKPSRDFLHYLKQEKMRERLLQAGITVPEEYASSYNDDILLNQKGEEWANIQLRKYREQRIEFWAKLIMPVLSLMLSVIALIVSIHGHK